MKDLNVNFKERTDFFKKIGPGIAGEMSKALQRLTAEQIKFEFSSHQTFKESAVFIDVREKCFGSYANFRSPGDNLKGIAVAIFPLSSTKAFVELLLKRHFRKLDKEAKDHEMKLSAFKEAVHILLMTYITGVANELKVKLKIGLPKFASFRNIEFMKHSLLRKYSNLKSLVSVGQFSIIASNQRFTGGAKMCRIPLLCPLLKGALLLFINTNAINDLHCHCDP